MKDSDWMLLQTLYHYNNLSKTAEHLFITQPALSKQLSRIEQEFDITIAIRSPKGLIFTEDGMYLVQKANQILGIIDETHKHFSAAAKHELIIGSSNTFIRSTLLRLINEYSQQAADEKIFITSGISPQILKSVQDGEIQIGFIRGEYQCGLVQYPVSEDGAWIVTNRPVSYKELETMPFIQHSRDTYTQNLFTQWWKENFDAPLSVAVGSNDSATSIETVRLGMGFSIVFDDYLSEADQLSLLPMKNRSGEQIRRRTYMVYRKEIQKLQQVRSFIHFIKNHTP